mgnify:FL=1
MVEDYRMKISELDDFKSRHPHLERYLGMMVPFGDPSRMNVGGLGQPDSGFEKYVIDRIRDNVPGNKMHERKTKRIREW